MSQEVFLNADQFDQIMGMLKSIRDAVLVMSQTKHMPGAGVAASNRSSKSRCKYCGESIEWAKTANGKNMPVDPDGQCHFDTCKSKRDPDGGIPAADESVDVPF